MRQDIEKIHKGLDQEGREAHLNMIKGLVLMRGASDV